MAKKKVLKKVKATTKKVATKAKAKPKAKAPIKKVTKKVTTVKVLKHDGQAPLGIKPAYEIPSAVQPTPDVI